MLELLQDLLTLYPTDLNLKTAIKLLDNMKKINPKVIIKGWKAGVNDEYRKQIENGDFDFFVNKDYDYDIGNELQQDSGQLLESIGIIKKKFSIMQENNKKKDNKICSEFNKTLRLIFFELV